APGARPEVRSPTPEANHGQTREAQPGVPAARVERGGVEAGAPAARFEGGAVEPFVSTDGPVISTRFRHEQGAWWDAYVADGGYVAAKKALSMTPPQIIDEISRANLRGLGGAGFPTGRKWSFIPKDNPKPK